MAHDVEDAAAAQAGERSWLMKCTGTATVTWAPGADPHEIDMQRRVADRMVLHVARQRAQRRAVESEVDEAGEEAGPREHPRQFARLEGDQDRLLAVAIDDAGNAAGAARRPGGALAGRGRGSALRLMSSAIEYSLLS